MVTVKDDFDGKKFAEKFELGPLDFYVRGEHLICNSLPDLTDEDISDCYVDQKYLKEKKQRPITARQKLKESGFLEMKYTDVNSYVNTEVTDLAGAKKVFKLILVILIAIRNIIKE